MWRQRTDYREDGLQRGRITEKTDYRENGLQGGRSSDQKYHMFDWDYSPVARMACKDEEFPLKAWTGLQEEGPDLWAGFTVPAVMSTAGLDDQGFLQSLQEVILEINMTRLCVDLIHLQRR